MNTLDTTCHRGRFAKVASITLLSPTYAHLPAASRGPNSISSSTAWPRDLCPLYTTRIFSPGYRGEQFPSVINPRNSGPHPTISHFPLKPMNAAASTSHSQSRSPESKIHLESHPYPTPGTQSYPGKGPSPPSWHVVAAQRWGVQAQTYMAGLRDNDVIFVMYLLRYFARGVLFSVHVLDTLVDVVVDSSQWKVNLYRQA